MTGLEIIAIERQEQIEKHGYTDELTKQNPHWYNKHQLSRVASLLLHSEDLTYSSKMHPMEMAIDLKMIEEWDEEKLRYMASKTYVERLVIAGALIAAEIDRINMLKEDKQDG